MPKIKHIEDFNYVYTSKIDISKIDNDILLENNSQFLIPTQYATKQYIDSKNSNNKFTEIIEEINLSNSISKNTIFQISLLNNILLNNIIQVFINGVYINQNYYSYLNNIITIEVLYDLDTTDLIHIKYKKEN